MPLFIFLFFTTFRSPSIKSSMKRKSLMSLPSPHIFNVLFAKYTFLINNSELRLIRHLENYKPINFSIIRTSLIKKIMKFYPSSKIDYLCPVRGISDEYLVSSLMVFSSKIKVINNLFLVNFELLIIL